METAEEDADRKEISSEFFLDILRLRGTSIEGLLDKILTNIYSESSAVAVDLETYISGRGTLLHIIIQQIVVDPENTDSLLSLFQDILNMAPRVWVNRPARIPDESKIYDYIVKRELCTLMGEPSVMDLACITGCVPVLRLMLEKGLYVRGVILRRGSPVPGYRYDVTKLVSGPVTNVLKYFMHVLVSYDSRYKMRTLLGRCKTNNSVDELFQIHPVRKVVDCYCGLTTKLYFMFAMFHIIYMTVFSYAACELTTPDHNVTTYSTKVLLYTVGITEPVLITAQLLIEMLKYTFVLLCMARDLRKVKAVGNSTGNEVVKRDVDKREGSTGKKPGPTTDGSQGEGISEVINHHISEEYSYEESAEAIDLDDVKAVGQALAHPHGRQEANVDRIYFTSLRRIVLHLPYLVLLCFVISRVDQPSGPREFNILSVTLFYGWILTFTLTDGIESVHFFIRVMLKIILYNVLKIAMVYIVILTAFSLALHSQFLASVQLTTTYRTPIDTMFLMFDIMMGNGEIFGADMEANMQSVGIAPIYSKILYIGYLVIAPIILLNLLIAMMNTSYSALEKEHSSEWKITATLFGLEFARAFPIIARCLRANDVQHVQRKMVGRVEVAWCVEMTVHELHEEVGESNRRLEDLLGDGQLAAKLNVLENRMDAVLIHLQTNQRRFEAEQRGLYEQQGDIREQQRKIRKHQRKMIKMIEKMTKPNTAEDHV